MAWEKRLWAARIRYVAGVDEVGRGALAGPVVAAAVIIPEGCEFSSLIRDSKTLTAKQREAALEEIQSIAVSIGIGSVGPETVDAVNVRQASRLAMKNAVEALDVPPDFVLVDAETLDLPCPQQSLIRGDQRSMAIAAASIVAKVTRDRMASAWEKAFPEYGFARHKGYATREHRQALAALGPCPIHRRTFLGVGKRRPSRTDCPGQQALWAEDTFDEQVGT